MNVGIIGAGLMGKKRAKALEGFNVTLLAVADTDEQRAKELAQTYHCSYTTDWKHIVQDETLDIIIISAIHQYLAEMAIAAIKNNKHVLIEKPAGRNLRELQKIKNVAQDHNVTIKIGYNHRFHPGILKAKELINQGAIGKLLYIRGRYGHGGRKDYNKEWRAFKNTAGGGELLDQGSHLIDLSRMFIGPFSSAIGYTPTFFWDMEVEDNGFALLRSPQGQLAFLHASWTQWKNLFSYELFGTTGELIIDGLGGSYGTETLTYYKMKPELGPPDKQTFDYPGEDQSWKLEFQNFMDAITKKTPINGSLDDAIANMMVIETIYKWNKKETRPS